MPVVFVQVTDPVGSGYVPSLARPGGNATGFTQFEFGISAKSIELLKQIAPGVMRVAVLSDPRVPSGLGMLGAIQSVAPMLGVELTSIGMRDASEMEGAITAYARGSNDGRRATNGGSSGLVTFAFDELRVDAGDFGPIAWKFRAGRAASATAV